MEATGGTRLNTTRRISMADLDLSQLLKSNQSQTMNVTQHRNSGLPSNRRHSMVAFAQTAKLLTQKRQNASKFDEFDSASDSSSDADTHSTPAFTTGSNQRKSTRRKLHFDIENAKELHSIAQENDYSDQMTFVSGIQFVPEPAKAESQTDIIDTQIEISDQFSSENHHSNPIISKMIAQKKQRNQGKS